MNPEFWNNKTVLITGHTGFKGSWLSLWLQHLGAKVIGYALNPPTTPNLFEKIDIASGMHSIKGDVRKLDDVKRVFNNYRPEIVIHMAAQSLVRYSYHHPVETYETNVMGSLNILEAIRSVDSVRAVLMITTDKCYDNKEWLWAYRENEAMGGHDPYSSSKACAEILIASYRKSFFPPETYQEHGTAIASVRSGNVIGAGDWANGRLLPDMVHAFQKNKRVKIRNPDAIRPWQYVLEPLAGYLTLAERLYTNGIEYAEAWNFGPLEEDAKTVHWIVKKMAELWGNNAQWEKDNSKHPHEANYLKLDCSKAHNKLQWWPKWSLEYALTKIIEWHKADLENRPLKEICLQHIQEYTVGKSDASDDDFH